MNDWMDGWMLDGYPDKTFFGTICYRFSLDMVGEHPKEAGSQ